MDSIISILRNQLVYRFINKAFEPYKIKQKTDFVLMFFTLIASLIIIIIINLLIISIYQVDEKQLLNELSGLFLEKFRHGLWPEPIERAQYLITIVFAPFIAFVTYYLFSKAINRIPGTQLNVIYYFSFLLSALLLLLLIYFDLKLNPDNFITIESRIFYRDIRNFIASIISGSAIYLALLSLPLVTYFIQLEDRGRLQNNSKIFFYIILSALIIDIFLISLFNRDNYFGGYDHFNAVYYSVAQVVNGKTLLVDFTNQYGLYPHFLQPIFKFIGFNILNYSIIMGLIVVLSYLCLFAFMKTAINNFFLLTLGFIGLVYLRGYFLTFFNYGDNYFQYTPIRFVFPCIILLLASFYFRNFNRKLYYVIFTIASISILWNIDTGVVVFLSWLAVLCFNELFNFKLKACFQNCFSHVLVGVVIFAVTILVYSVLMYARSGFFPDYSLVIKSQKVFYVSGFYMMHMPVFNAWNLIALIYAIGLIKCVKSIIKNEKTHNIIIVFLLTILGIGLFSYYQGRSHDFNLFVVHYPAFILLIIFADDLSAGIQTYGYKSLPKLFYLSLILFLLLTFFYDFLSKYDKSYQLLAARLSVINKLTNASLTENISYIKQNTRAGEDVLILSEGFLDGIYYGDTGTTNAANVPGFSELMLQEDYDKIIHFLKSNGNVKVFIDNRYKDNLIREVLLGNYSLIDQNNEIQFYLPIESAQKALVAHFQGFAKYHLITPEEPLVENLENFPATFPLAEILIELSESAILNSVSVTASNNLGNIVGNWTSKPVSHLWGIGIIDKESTVQIRNNGFRKGNLDLPIGQKLTLLIPDNGNLSACPPLEINLTYNGYRHLSIIANCK